MRLQHPLTTLPLELDRWEGGQEGRLGRRGRDDMSSTGSGGDELGVVTGLQCGAALGAKWAGNASESKHMFQIRPCLISVSVCPQRNPMGNCETLGGTVRHNCEI